MTDQTLIPPSPTEDDYVRQVTTAAPPEQLSARDPFALFGEWFGEAVKSEPNDGNAMSLATVDEAGMPDLRMVLLKGFDAEGFVFFTNLESAKGRELAANPKAALLFHWKSLRRQVRIRGAVSAVSDAEADAYFATRARPAQIGAWASDQSQPLASRTALMAEVAKVTATHGVNPKRPPFWGGFRLVPLEIEFWADGAFRLHDRFKWTRQGPEMPWKITRLNP